MSKLKNVIFKDLTVIYDSKGHSIYLVNLPEEYEVSYVGNNVSEIGVHSVVAEIYYKGELVKEITAKITIKNPTNVELPLV